ncbi:MAG TPA: sigma-70 factor domain-containing protein, partial [Dissulfurispiraceae bacterium]
MKEPFEIYGEGFNKQDPDFSGNSLDELSTIETTEPLDSEIIKESIEQEYDPLKAYLKGISLIPLLTKDGEVEIAKQIEECKLKICGALFTIPFVLNKLVALGRLVEKGEAPLTEIIQDGEELSEEDLDA